MGCATLSYCLSPTPGQEQEQWLIGQILIMIFVHCLFYLLLYYWTVFNRKHILWGAHWKCLGERLLLSTHNIQFCGEVQKIFIATDKMGYPHNIFLISP